MTDRDLSCDPKGGPGAVNMSLKQAIEANTASEHVREACFGRTSHGTSHSEREGRHSEMAIEN